MTTTNSNKEQLKELKRGNVGTGLLIESDGYISLNEGKNKVIKEAIDNSSDWFCPYPFKVSAVFQKADIKNANGRIYPRAILEREIENYQTVIKEHRALGECYTPDALVLTEYGWKNITEVKEGENVLTLNVDKNEIEVKPIIRTIEKDFDDNLIKFESDSINEMVTPNHEVLLYDIDNKKYFKVKASSLLKESYTNVIIPSLKELFIYTDSVTKYTPYGISIDKEHLKVSEESYRGKVYCIEVENHNFYVMVNGKNHWTGNCNHPSESTIDLSRVSHNITELHWEGNTVVGEMELNVTQGFVREGIISSCGDQVANLLLNGYKIGVSSRAVGSVENKLGTLMVGDDLELICWDVVSQPSTPNAYIASSRDKLEPYIESKNNQGTVISEKISKLKDVLG